MSMEITRPRSPLWASLLRMLVGAAIGAAAVWLYFSFARDLRWSDMIALMLALVCGIGAVRLFLDSLNRRALGRMLQVEGESSDEETAQARWHAAMMGVLGLMLIWPPVATLAGAPAPLWTYLVVAAALIANLWFTWRVFEGSDEYARQRMLEATWRASLAGQALLIAYAGAERLGLVPALTAWDVLVVFTAVSMLTPLFGSSQRGSAR